MRKKILLGLAGILFVGGIVLYLSNREPPVDTSYTGAYRLEDGMLVVLIPRDAESLRFKKMNGETGAVYKKKTDTFEGGEGWAEREPVTNSFQFARNAEGKVTGFTWQHAKGAAPNKATRLPLREEIVTFPSGDLTLRGKLVLPEGDGPFPVVIPVHGSGEDSAVEGYSEPYLHAANGFAGFAYDKRGTGGSSGQFTANFDLLSDDTVAAAKYLRTRKEIDGTNIHLIGLSQGGWIAPWAALKDKNIRSVFVGFGVAVPVLGEDRWGYVYAFQEKGFGDKEIAEMDQVAAILGDIVDRKQDRWDDFQKALDASRSKPWFETAKHSDSIFGMIVGTDKPLWMVRPYLWWNFGRLDPPFIDRLYEPADTLAKLDTPSMWVFGGKDSSAPTQWSVEALQKLQAAGKPIEYFIYPNAEHGILRFEQSADGERKMIGYEPGYFQQQIDWFRRQSGR